MKDSRQRQAYSMFVGLVFTLSIPCCTLGWSPLKRIASSKADTRRSVLTQGIALFGIVGPASKAVAVNWKWSDVAKGGFPVFVDGEERNIVGQKGPASVQLHYDTAPDKVSRITVYQRTGTASIQRLKDAASKLGVPRALDIGDRIGSDLADLKTARLVADGLYSLPSGLACYTFDLVSADDDKRYLISSTVLNERLYVFVMETNAKDFEADPLTANQLIAVRNSFSVRVAPL